MKRRFFIVIAILLLGASGIWWFFFQKQQSLSYKTAVIDRGNIYNTVSATGNVDYAFKHYVYAKTGGIVIGVDVSPGNQVKAGQILATIDKTDQRLSYEKLKQALIQQSNTMVSAKKEYKDIKKLYEKQFVSLSELEEAKINYENALASYQQSLLDLQESIETLQNCTLISPVSGVVAFSALTVGTNLPDSTTLAFIIASRPPMMQIEFLVSEVDISSIKKGQKVRFTASAYTNTFTGEVSEIWNQPQTSQDVVYYPVIILVENTNGKLLPGMSVSGEIIIQGKENILHVPSRALRIRPTREMLAKIRPEPPHRPLDELQKGHKRRPVHATNTAPTSIATLWLIKTNTEKIRPLRVRTGISDGQYTEIIPLDRNKNLEGETVITAIRTTKSSSKIFSSKTQKTSSQSQRKRRVYPGAQGRMPLGGPGGHPPGF